MSKKLTDEELEERRLKDLYKRKENFINKSKEIHGDKYDYSKVDYINNHTKVEIICPIHGSFWQTPNSHTGKPISEGCRKCGIYRRIEASKKTTEEFISLSRKIHGDWYDYSKSVYTGCYDPVCIICPEHGEFWQSPLVHCKGCGCYECGLKKISEFKSLGLYKFIERSKEIHGDRYNYSKVEYKGIYEPVCIICPTHGEFWQKPCDHLGGHSGCKICNDSSGESFIRTWLTNRNIQFKSKVTIKNKIKGRNTNLVNIDFQFILDEIEYWIEFNGEQHYFEKLFFHNTHDDFLKQQKRDQNIREYCKDNSIILLEIPYTFNTYQKIDELLSNVLIRKININSLIDLSQFLNKD